MKEDRLTANAIDKLIGGVNGVIVQLLVVTPKNRNGQKFYGLELNDGFCKLKGCLVVDEEVFSEGKLMQEYLVVKIVRSMSQQNKAREPIIIVEDYKVHSDQVSAVIGEPLPYEEYLRKGKTNQNGSNVFQIGGNPKKQTKTKYEDLLDETKEEEGPTSIRGKDPLSKNTSSLASKGIQNKKADKNQSITTSRPNNQTTINLSKGNLRLSTEEENRKAASNQTSNNSGNARHNSLSSNMNQNSNQSSLNTSKPKNYQSPNRNNPDLKKNENRMRAGPIQKVEERLNLSGMRGNQNRQSTEYNSIKSLYAGMENFTLLARVLTVNPPKTFINKRGVQSLLLNIEIGDRSGTIECSMFGEVAQRFENSFKEDQVYELANASVVENTYMGNHELKLTINQSARINLKEDDTSVPLAEDFCVSVKQLVNVPIGETVRVICLIKDNGETINFVSKAGKEMRKKAIELCDPIEKVEVQLTLWKDKCDMVFEKQPYLIKGVQVKEFNSTRQYGLSINCGFRVLKYHNLRRYVKEIDHISFSNPDSEQKKRGLITNIKDINNLMDEVKDKGTWSEIVCAIASINMTLKHFYLSCPSCNKKVTEERDGQCDNCGKGFEEAGAKYNLKLTICDFHDSVFATAFNEVAEKIMGVPAAKFARMSEEEMQQLGKEIRGRQFKMKLVTKNEEYNNEVKKKTNIIKVLPINYAEETKALLAKIEQSLREGQ